MLGLFETRERRLKDKREIRYFYSKYGADAPDILSERAHDSSLSSRDRKHWARLARKARRQISDWQSDTEPG